MKKQQPYTILRQRVRRVGCLVLALLGIAAGGTPGLADKALPAQTALDRYIAEPDDSYSWKIVKKSPHPGMRAYVLDMVSQTWRTTRDVDQPTWRHWLTVVSPDQGTSKIGFLFVGGGRNGGDAPEEPTDIVMKIAQATGTVVAELRMVPNQPLVFHNDGRPRSEDDLVAYTWDQFLRTGDATWPARNPMVKSAVRAMDTISQLLASDEGGNRTVDRFVVAGGSKRGWTTWLTGAVDSRVVAIVPIVIDVLNVQASMRHHYGAYGFWAPSIGDYVEHGITARMDHPRMTELCELVDPYAYRHRLTLPKFIVNAAGDQFFLPDSSRFYFDDLQGEKYLRYVPNSDHSLKETDALESILAFYWMIVQGKQRPRFSWSPAGEGSIRLQTVDRPQQVTLWQATNAEARDFRLESLGAKYTSRPLQDRGDGLYVAEVPTPTKGWTAFFAELLYDVGGPVPAKFTTNVRVIPDVLPHADRDLARPPTISIRCTAPDDATATAIQEEVARYFDASPQTGVNAPWSPKAGSAGRGARKQATSSHSPEPIAPIAANGDRGRVERSGRSLDVRVPPSGDRLRDTAQAVTAWLKRQGCSGFDYRLHAGLE